MVPTINDLIDYFERKKRRLCYEDAKELYSSLKTHFNGEFPERLISQRRPSETDDIFEYRKAIYEPVTKEACAPIITSLSKIKRSSDWSIKYDESAFAKNIAEGETLEKYCEYNFPFHYASVTNWAFAVLLKNLLVDANGVILMMPLDTNIAANDYLEPFPIIFNSDQVYEYQHNKLVVLLSVEKTADKGNIFYVVTDEVIQRWEAAPPASKQQKSGVDYIMAYEYRHELPCIPCFRLCGIFKKSYGTDYLDESRVASIVPRLNEAAREYSDLQAEVVQHIFSEKWEYGTQKCEECNGSGIAVIAATSGKAKSGVGKKQLNCQKCNGTGTMGVGPYKKIVIRPASASLGELPTPTPPAGYVQKQIDIARLQDDRVDKHIYKALSTINMQFLAQSPVNQSGKAKEVDKDELNNFIYSVAEDMVKIMDLIYLFINEYRYRLLVPNEKERRKMLPTIPVPEKYDILSSGYLLQDMTASKSAGLNAVTLMTFEIDFVQKRFYDRPEARDLLQMVFELDPLPAITEDEKLARLQGGGILQTDYIISCNILPFIRRAMEEDAGFFKLRRCEQREKMLEFAEGVKEGNELKSNSSV